MSPLALVPVDSALGCVVALLALAYPVPVLVRALVDQTRTAARADRHVARFRP